MIKEIFPGIYLIPVPLPRNPLKALNSYLIKGNPRHLLIDTGFPQTECREALLAGLEESGVKLSEIDYFVTHVHGDHSGLVCELLEPECRVYCSRIDAQILQACTGDEYWRKLDAIFAMHGFPVLKSQQAGNRVQGYISGSDINFTFVDEGYVLEAGGYKMVCIMTPGHSPGHMCLYEPNHKIFIAGDHILDDISPNITFWGEMEDSLGHYLESLEKVNKLDINLVLPGHRRLIRDHQKRIAELKEHHQHRLDEVLAILAKDSMNAYQVASHMEWDLNYEDWGQVPHFQQWFATGEAIAHIDYLVHRNRLRKIEQDGLIAYELV